MMRPPLAMTLIAATLALAHGPAQAADVSYIAETASTARRQGAVSAGEVAWQCDGVKCVGIGPWSTPPPSLCVALAREVGPMRVFAQFAPTEVAACNQAAASGRPADAPKAAPAAKPAPGSGRV